MRVVHGEVVESLQFTRPAHPTVIKVYDAAVTALWMASA